MSDVTDLKAEVLTLRMENKELWGQVERLRQENQSIGMAAYELGRKSMADENAKLRNQLHDQQDTAQHNFVRNAREYKRVCDENAKLRELVADLWTHCPADRYYCSLCEYGNDDGSECKLADRMRELGVEVDA